MKKKKKRVSSKEKLLTKRAYALINNNLINIIKTNYPLKACYFTLLNKIFGMLDFNKGSNSPFYFLTT